MAKIKQDFDLFAGEDKQINFTITDDAGDPVDLTGTNAVWVLARLRSVQENLIEKTVDGGGITISSNVYQVHLDEGDTDQLSGKYRHELRMIDSAGQIETVLAIGQGQVYNSLTKDITI